MLTKALGVSITTFHPFHAKCINIKSFRVFLEVGKRLITLQSAAAAGSLLGTAVVDEQSGLARPKIWPERFRKTAASDRAREAMAAPEWACSGFWDRKDVPESGFLARTVRGEDPRSLRWSCASGRLRCGGVRAWQDSWCPERNFASVSNIVKISSAKEINDRAR